MVSDEKAIGIPGSVEVDEGVIQDMVGAIALTSYGVAGMSAGRIGGGIARILPVGNLRRGIAVANHGESVSIEMGIIVQYGTNLSVVAENLAETVRYALEDQLGIPTDDVVINVQGINV